MTTNHRAQPTLPVRDQAPQVVARGEHGQWCAVLGCGEVRTHLRAAESGWMIGYCAAHCEQATRLFGPRAKEEGAA